MAEQPTGKESIVNYIKELEKLKLENKEAELLREKLVGNLDVLSYPLTTIMSRIEDDGNKIKEHWTEYGDNYNALPVLHSTIPRYNESFGEFIALAFKEKKILIDLIIKLFEIAEKVPENSIEVLPEKKEEDIIVEPEKKVKKKVKKKKEKKIEVIEPKEDEENE